MLSGGLWWAWSGWMNVGLRYDMMGWLLGM